MSFLATSTYLGDLDILEIYVQYNGPRLLACKNQVNKIFFVLWVNEEEDSELWLYMLVSIERLQTIRTGAISLYQAFAEPETETLYEVTCNDANHEWNVRQTLVSELDHDYLPLEDTFLSCDPDSLPQIILPYPLTIPHNSLNIFDVDT